MFLFVFKANTCFTSNYYLKFRYMSKVLCLMDYQIVNENTMCLCSGSYGPAFNVHNPTDLGEKKNIYWAP